MLDAGMIGDKWGGMKGKVGKKKRIIQNAIATILYLSEIALDQPPWVKPHKRKAPFTFLPHIAVIH